jgi:hypothetical protein
MVAFEIRSCPSAYGEGVMTVRVLRNNSLTKSSVSKGSQVMRLVAATVTFAKHNRVRAKPVHVEIVGHEITAHALGNLQRKALVPHLNT